MTNVSFDVIAFLIIGATIGHVALIASSRWLNPIFLIAAAYCFLAPISAAPELPYVGIAKWARVYVTLLLLFVGFFIQRLYHLRAAAWAWLFFVGFYVLAGLWSDAPVAALKYKGLYGLAVLGGFMLAYSVRDYRDLQVGVRLLIVGGAVFSGAILLQYLSNPLALLRNERLSFWDMNPNRVGLELAPIVILAAYIALYDSVATWRRIAYVIGTMSGVMLIFTGSRGAAGEALLGCFIVTIPSFRRPGLLIVVGAFVGIAVLTALATSEIEATERLLDPSLANRQGVWSRAMEEFKEAPLFGQGWVYTLRGGDAFSTANMHSIYLQTLVEAGLLGAALMAIAMVYALFSAIRLPHYLGVAGARVPAAYLALGLVVAVLAHGFIEAATTRGSNLNALMLPFALGLLDRLPELLQTEYDDDAWIVGAHETELTEEGWREGAAQPISGGSGGY